MSAFSACEYRHFCRSRVRAGPFSSKAAPCEHVARRAQAERAISPAHFCALLIVTGTAKTTGLVREAHRAGRPKGSAQILISIAHFWPISEVGHNEIEASILRKRPFRFGSVSVAYSSNASSRDRTSSYQWSTDETFGKKQPLDLNRLSKAEFSGSKFHFSRQANSVSTTMELEPHSTGLIDDD